MINTIDSLSQEDQHLIYDAIPLVTLLIANADGDIDPKELEWGEKIADIRSFSFDEEWQVYYEKVSTKMHNRLEELINELPSDSGAMQADLTNRLASLNDILDKFESEDARNFTEGLRSFAERIAKADGGVFGWFSIGPKEKEVIDLPMIKKYEA
jgi:hypothetical protein